MDFSNEALISGVKAGNLRSVSRLITLAENGVPRARTVMAELYRSGGHAHVIGVTGSPGAGKSTLVDQLASAFRKDGKKVAILAIDPTSPFSGGAVLGDRIRMVKTAEDQTILIRSMATRGALGGLSRGTLDAVQILDAAGFDVIFVETVGVGQAEVDIVRTADTCVVVLVPGMGDSVQAIKAGILEIADLFVINKADRDGADMLHKDIRILLSLAEYEEGSFKPPILRTVATDGSGVSEVVESLGEHTEWLSTSKEGKKRRLKILEERVMKLASEILYENLAQVAHDRVPGLIADCFEKRTDPYAVVEKLVGEVLSGKGKNG